MIDDAVKEKDGKSLPPEVPPTSQKRGDEG
jgi:hypothetical protein